MENIPVHVENTTLKQAMDRGVIAFFGEKYNPEKVRMVEVPGFSAELCGGTHVHATGDIGCFKITEVSALSAGNRRIVAVTGPAAIALFQQNFTTVKILSQEYKVPQEAVSEAIKKQKDQIKELQSSLKELKKNMYHHLMPEWIKKSEKYGRVPVLYLIVPNALPEDLREIAQDFMKIQPGLYFLVGKSPSRSSYYVALSQELSGHVPFKEFTAWLKEQGLQGGGSGLSYQGSGAELGLDLEYNLKKWLQDHIK